MQGAVDRVWPKMMTVTAIAAGLQPILWNEGAGSEIMQRIALPIIGGMASSTVLTLLVIPAIYGLVEDWGHRRSHDPSPVPQAFGSAGSAGPRTGGPLAPP